MQRILAVSTAVVLIVIGILAQQDPYRLRDPGHPADQQVLAHRDSSYTHISWVTSQTQNYAQLRFYDRVEGGVCLQPSWADLAQLSPGTLGHLAQPADYPTQLPPPASSWPDDQPKPDMGTLTNTKYIAMYPLAVLLNQRLMAEAGGEARKAAPNVLIVGLGSGVGVAILAHHFPEASITVVDIDRKVNEMVLDHYPLLRWLAEDAPLTAAGHKRLTLLANDARQAVIYPQLRPDTRPYDIVVLDAYTSGSTIPPHLMTREFYAEVKRAMTADGIMLSNIIGSYLGPQRLLLGGAIRSMRAAGLEHVHNFPILYPRYREGEPAFGPSEQRGSRNNVVLASQTPLDPKANRAGWAAIEAFARAGEPYADLPLRRYTSVYAMVESADSLSMAASLLGPEGEALDPKLNAALLKAYGGDQPWDQRHSFMVDDQSLIRSAIQAVRAAASAAGRPIPGGWDEENPRRMRVSFVDWVLHARSTFTHSIHQAQEQASLTRFLHSARHLVGPLEDERDETAAEDWVIKGVPLFTDGQPNADIYNH